MKIAAPAKINLALHVTGQRADGYHLLESLIAFADVGDTLTIEAAASDSLTFSGPFGSSLSADTVTNLVIKARDALRAAAGSSPCPPVAIHLEKNLPLSSGIGGGSTDAAAALKGLNDHWALGLTLGELCNIGVLLGADVPMCLHGRPLKARGIGDIIEPVTLPAFHMLLVNPGTSVSTPAIFRSLTKKENGGLPALLPHHAGKSGLADLLSYLQSTRNDLQPPAFAIRPEIESVITALETHGAQFARMSGSGATCFGIFADDGSAAEAAAIMRSEHPHWWVA